MHHLSLGRQARGGEGSQAPGAAGGECELTRTKPGSLCQAHAVGVRWAPGAPTVCLLPAPPDTEHVLQARHRARLRPCSSFPRTGLRGQNVEPITCKPTGQTGQRWAGGCRRGGHRVRRGAVSVSEPEGLNEAGERGEGAARRSLLAPGPSAGLAHCWVLGPHAVVTLFHGTVPSGVWLPSLPTPCPFPLIFWTLLGLMGWSQRLDFICRRWGAPGVTEGVEAAGWGGRQGSARGSGGHWQRHPFGNFAKGLQHATRCSGHQRHGGE